MFYVYLIKRDVSEEIYIGFTKDIKQRLRQHNGGQNISTRRRKDGKWKLMYAEIYVSEVDARLRERKLKKHGSGKHELIKRLKNTLLDI